jgi:hypothetical protein
MSLLVTVLILLHLLDGVQAGGTDSLLVGAGESLLSTPPAGVRLGDTSLSLILLGLKGIQDGADGEHDDTLL